MKEYFFLVAIDTCVCDSFQIVCNTTVSIHHPRMATTDESLEKYFNRNMIKSDGKNKWFGTLEDLIEWFERIKVFEQLDILHLDVEESVKKMRKKHKTFPFRHKKSSKITFKEFNWILDELAVKMGLEPVDLKIKLLNLIEHPVKDNPEEFKNIFEKMHKRFESIAEWVWSTTTIDKTKIRKSDLVASFKTSNENPEKFTYEDLKHGFSRLAAKYNIDAEGLLKSFIKDQLDPGIMPLPDDIE